MHSARNSRVSQKLALSACVIAALVAGGCDNVGQLQNGWFSPADAGRFKKEPLLMPIVQTLDAGVEEPNDQFAHAVDVDAQDLVSSNDDYVVGKNDLLSISITDLVAPGVETVKQARVSESGNVSLPLVGQVKAVGLTEAQLESEIQRVYRDNNLMPQAQVSVSVQQALARTFSILGSVARPGQYQITQTDFRILDALVTAGDITSQGVDFLYVIRREDMNIVPTTAPAGATTKPAGPDDVLTPRTQANPQTNDRKVVMLIQDAAAPATPETPATPPAEAPKAPAEAPKAPDAPAAPAPGQPGEGQYIIIDGKPVLVGNQGATVEGATPSSVPATEESGLIKAPATQGFEFAGPRTGTNNRIIRVPVTQLKNGDLRYNIVIRAQDMVIAPPPITGEYYMDGHLLRTGVYSLTARNITLKQAVAAAGGMDGLAIPSTHTDIIRRIGADKEIFARVDLVKVMSGEQPDIYLKPNDVVRVGTNAFAPFFAAFRNAFRFTYGFGFLYDRNYAPEQQQQN